MPTCRRLMQYGRWTLVVCSTWWMEERYVLYRRDPETDIYSQSKFLDKSMGCYRDINEAKAAFHKHKRH